MKKYILIIATFITLTVAAQKPKPSEGHYGCTYLEQPNYIVNKESVFFENCAIHRKVNVNPEALRIVEEGLAFDNNTMFYNGIKLNIKPKKPKVVSTSFPNNVYWINNGILYRNEVEMTKVDEQSFIVLGADYFKDTNHVYYKEKIIEDVDTDSFIFDYQFCYDKNTVYIQGNKLMLNGAVQAVNNHFCKDKSTVYKYNNYRYLFNLEPLLDILVDNAKAIPKTRYGVINDTLYYQNKKTAYTNVDTNHVKVFSDNIIGFNNKIIYKGIATDKFDYRSIQILNNKGYGCLLKDENGRYSMNIQNDSLIIKPATEVKKDKPIASIAYTKISPLQIISNVLLYQGTYPLAEQALLTQKGMTDFDTLELVSVLKGYRMGCSRDTQSASNYYILRNSQGYWKLKVSREDMITFIGKTYNF